MITFQYTLQFSLLQKLPYNSHLICNKRHLNILSTKNQFVVHCQSPARQLGCRFISATRIVNFSKMILQVNVSYKPLTHPQSF